MTETTHIDLSKLRINRGEQSPNNSPQPRKKRMLVLGGVGAVIIAAAYFILQANLEGAVEVQTTSVRLVSLAQASSVLTANGYVVAQRKASVASKATGRLVYLGFEEGDRVKKGDIIARIESADVEAALAQARGSLAMSKAELTDAKQSFERAQVLFDKKLISQAEYDAAKARYDRVIASITAGEAGVRAAGVQVENTFIRAPFDGTILTKNADVGEVVAPFAAGASSRVAVVTLADMSSLEVEADVSESNIERVTPNQPCEIILDAYPEQRYRGFVNKVVPTADRAKATVLTKIRFVERDSRVLPEMSAKVYFLSAQRAMEESSAPKTMVSTTAIVERGGKKIAFRVKDNIAEEVGVQTGSAAGDLVEVLSGLSANDIVIMNPPERLKSGTKIKTK